jgi:hypothetical protein
MSMDEGSPKPKLSKKQRELASLAFEVGLILLLIGVGTVTYNKRHTTTKVEEKTVTVTASPQAAAPGLSAVSPTNETVTVPVSGGYKLTLQAPKSWRTVDIAGWASIEGFGGEDIEAALRFVPDNPERQTLYGPMEPTSSLDVVATSKWVNVDGDSPATAANKRGYLGYLASLQSAGDITSKRCVAISVEDNRCSDTKVKPQVIKSADGSLSGVAYLTMQNQAASYDPVVRIEMVGTAGGKAVWASGMFAIHDKLSETLSTHGAKADTASSDFVSRVMSAREDFNGGKVAADTQAAYDKIVAVVKTMKFAK